MSLWEKGSGNSLFDRKCKTNEELALPSRTGPLRSKKTVTERVSQTVTRGGKLRVEFRVGKNGKRFTPHISQVLYITQDFKYGRTIICNRGEVSDPRKNLTERKGAKHCPEWFVDAGYTKTGAKEER